MGEGFRSEACASLRGTLKPMVGREEGMGIWRFGPSMTSSIHAVVQSTLPSDN
jgi:hypothetical protein